jgi:hypothetical protein
LVIAARRSFWLVQTKHAHCRPSDGTQVSSELLIAATLSDPKASSRVNWSAGPVVKAERLHDGERGGSGEDLDVGGGSTPVYLAMTARPPLGDRVEVGFHPGPKFSRTSCKGHRVDAASASFTLASMSAM